MTDYRQNIVIVMGLLIVLMLYSMQKLKAQNIVAILVIIGVSFIMPMLSVVFMMPIFLLVIMTNSQGVAAMWSNLKNATIG